VFGQNAWVRGKQRIRSLLTPKTLIATILGAVLLVTLLSFADIDRVWHLIQGFPLLLIAVLFMLVVGREVLRSAEWRILLEAIGIHASRRAAFLTLSGGDAAQVLPGGLYFQDLLVSREFGGSVSKPLAATMVMVWMEMTMAMLALGTVGLPGVPELRSVMLVCGVGSLATLLAVRPRMLKWVRQRTARAQVGHGGIAGRVLVELDHFTGALAELAHPKVIGSGLAFCAAYMALTFYGFYLVCAGLHLSHIGFADAVAVYSLVLAIVIVNPLPSDLGVSEASGVGASRLFTLA